jgi:hypothetical protein
MNAYPTAKAHAALALDLYINGKRELGQISVRAEDCHQSEF